MSSASPASPLEALRVAKESLRPLLPNVAPSLGIVLGSGLGSLTERLTDKIHVAYDDIPHFPRTTVRGHGGELVVGRLEGRLVFCLSGRSHLYEGHQPNQVVFGVRLLRLLGASSLLLTNAAGGIGPTCEPGRLMAITDHINLTGRSPLEGPNDEGLGPRFPDMSEVYDPEFLALIHSAALEMELEVAEGVYAGVLGPAYETPAEIHMLEVLGASAVGMSTVHEAIASKHMGTRIAGISCITNYAAGKSEQKLSHEDVAKVAAQASEDFCGLVTRFVATLPSAN